MKRVNFKPDHLLIHQPGFKIEAFPLVGNPCYMKLQDEDVIAIELGTDWIAFEDSELIGGSEALAKIWGLQVSIDDLRRGRSRPIKPPVKDERPLDGGIFAWFFGSIGRRVGAVAITLCGDNRVKIRMDVEDVTEETDDCSTILTVDTTLSECVDELQCPF